MPMTKMLKVELFDMWGIDFMFPFVSSYDHKYILVIVDHLFKWVETKTLADNEGKSVLAFFRKNIFSRFGNSHTIISEGGSNFFNKVLRFALAKYRLKQ